MAETGRTIRLAERLGRLTASGVDGDAAERTLGGSKNPDGGLTFRFTLPATARADGDDG